MAAGSAANMKGPRELPVAPDSKVISQGSERGHPRSKPNLATLSPRLVLGAGFVVLAAFSAASIGFDVKSRSEAAWVNHTLEVSNKFADMRLLFRHTESSARGYLLSGDRYFADDYHQRLDRIAPAFTALKDAVKDNDAQLRLLASTEALVVSRFSVTSEALRLHMAGDVAGMAALTAKADGRTLMESVDARFDQLAKEEQRLLGVRSAESERTGGVLLAIELSCAALILILASILIGEGRRSSRKQQTVQRATEAANETLEAAVLERTGHMHAANEQLRQSASVLSSTFAGMAEAVLVIDNNGSVALANSAAERLLHYCPGMTISQLWAQNVAYQADGSTLLVLDEKPAARVLRGEQFDGLDVVVRRAGSRDSTHLVVSGRPLHDAFGAVSGGALVFHDVTAARETERKLHQSQKLDAIGKLNGGVAHDFNNMLTVIGGTTEFLVAELRDRPDLLTMASPIDQAADRCAGLIQQLLAFARKQPLQPRIIELNATIADIAKLLRPSLGEQIEVVSIVEKTVSTVCIDPSQLANALINLAINARDAMPDGGQILLETASVVLDEAYVQRNAGARSGAHVMIAVSDTGTGMSAEVRENVFEPFFTTKEQGKGTGLGLSMVYGFVKQSDGHITIYSEEGHGTTIRLYLPASSGCAEAVVPVVAATLGAGETILVVEDDALVRRFVIAQLHNLGYRTIAVADGSSALAYVESGLPFDLLFTDVVMPGGMSGRQLADEVATRRPGTKVLFTSGYTENAILHHGRLDQGVMLLSKPYRKSALAGRVRLALGDAAANSRELEPIPLADTSVLVPMRRQPAGSQAPSSNR
jgi:signal transduction histidine kinase/CHASE3 domain sensor protein/ActR/RegA family two-component response regulator